MQLIIDSLSKTYPNGIKALQKVSLKIAPGMFGLLGPNGAGKSTLMRTLATLQDVDEGSIQLGDIDLQTDKHAVRKVLGYLPQQFGLYPKMSAQELLNHFAILKGFTHTGQRRELIKSLLHRTNLYTVRKQHLGGFSGGMKQRFGIAQALLNSPKLLIVDEPTAGLDPKERNRFYTFLSEIAENTIVILSTHIVDDVRELCTQMAIMNNGQVVVQGSPLQLIAGLQGKVYQKMIKPSELEKHRQQFHVINHKRFLGKPMIQIISDSPPGHGFTPVDSNLEAVYFSQINH
ncbi:MAG: ABC transporter ATP-binding protein [Bacteroidota bacterium]